MFINFQVFEAPLLERIARLAEVTNKSIGQVFRDRAPTLARYLATATMPIAGLARDGGSANGLGKEAHTLGMKAVTRDVSRVYKSPNGIVSQIAQSYGNKGVGMARGFFGMMKRGEMVQAKALLSRAKVGGESVQIIEWDGGKRHKEARVKGRVPKSTRAVVISDAKKLAEYTEMRRGNVGFAKAGWVNAASRMGRTKTTIPRWISKHTSAPGHGNDFTNDILAPRFELTNSVNYLSEILSERYLLMATASFERSLKKEVNIVVAKLAARENA